MAETREAAFKIFVATSGCGKTTDIKTLLTDKRRNLVIPSGRHDVAWHGYKELTYKVVQAEDEWNPGKKRPKVIINELNTFTGTRVLHVDGKQPVFDAVIDIVHGYTNGRVVMDDFRNYIFSGSTLRHEVASFFKNRRHKMVDIFMACHAPEDISRDILALNPMLVVGMTTTNPTDTTIGKLPSGKRFLDTIMRVRSINQQRPEGQRWYKEQIQM
jgi:hypothetical protein